MIAGLMMGGALAVGGLLGGISASKAAKRAKAMVEEQKRENEDWYNRRYNEDATQRADAQRILTRTAEAIKGRNKAAAGRSAVMGGDDASVAQEKERNAEAMSDAVSNIAAMGEARKDSVESQYRQRDQALDDELIKIEQNKAQQISQATGGLMNAAGSIADNF